MSARDIRCERLNRWVTIVLDLGWPPYQTILVSEVRGRFARWRFWSVVISPCSLLSLIITLTRTMCAEILSCYTSRLRDMLAVLIDSYNLFNQLLSMLLLSHNPHVQTRYLRPFRPSPNSNHQNLCTSWGYSLVPMLLCTGSQHPPLALILQPRVPLFIRVIVNQHLRLVNEMMPLHLVLGRALSLFPLDFVVGVHERPIRGLLS
jgi:hypothetical protein